MLLCVAAGEFVVAASSKLLADQPTLFLGEVTDLAGKTEKH